MKALIVAIIVTLIAGCSTVGVPAGTTATGQRHDMTYRGGP